MKEELEVSRQKLDLYGDKHISLHFDSNILKKLTDLQCCHSYTYEIPATTHNMDVFGLWEYVTIDNNDFRQPRTCKLLIDGIPIIIGNCHIVNYDRKSISIVLLFGINLQLQAMKDAKLKLCDIFNYPGKEYGSKSHIWRGDDYIDYYINRRLPIQSWGGVNETTHIRGNEDVFCAVGMINRLNGSEYHCDLDKIQYAVNVDKGILYPLSDRFGFQFDGLFDSANDWIQFKHQKCKKDLFVLKTSLTQKIFATNSFTPAFVDQGRLYDSDINSNDIAELTATAYYLKSKYRLISLSYEVDKSESVDWAEITLILHIGDKSSIRIGNILTKNADTINFEDYGNIVIDKREPLLIEFAGTAISLLSAHWELQCQYEDDDAENGCNFNLYDTMPDIEVMTFISDYAFARYLKFPVNQLRSEKLKFVGLYDIIDADMIDWSDKLSDKAIKISYSYDNLAKKNWIVLAKDDSESIYQGTHVFDISFYANTSNQADEAEYNQLMYTVPILQDYADGLRRYSYVLKNGDKDTSPAPRIIKVGSLPTSIDSHHPLSFVESSLAIKDEDLMKSFRNTLMNPTILECEIVLDAIDLLDLDFSRPIFFRQFGAKWAILTIDFSAESNTAKIKLIKLKR